MVTRFNKIDLKLYKLETIQKVHNKTIVPIRDPIMFQTPKIFLPFLYEKTLKLTFANIEYDTQVKEFSEVLINLDKHLKQLFLNKFPQFKKKHIWKPIINKDFIYADMDKQIQFYNRSRQLVKSLDTPTYVRAIINIDSIWISDDKIGINLKCYQLQTFGNDIHLTGYSFIDDLNIIKCEYREEIKEVVKNPVELHDKYGKYFKMKKMGIPNEAIQQKIKLDGLNPEVINYAPDIDVSKIKELSDELDDELRDELGDELGDDKEVKEVKLNIREPLKINAGLLLAGLGGLKKVDPKTLIKKKLKENNKGWNPPTIEELNNILSNLRKAS
jgi:hypothetical protein